MIAAYPTAFTEHLALPAIAAPWPQRVAIVGAHPDDEAVGLGSRLHRFGENVLVVCVTDGAPRDMRDALRCGFSTRQQYADARREEVVAVLRRAGLDESCYRPLEFVDQEAAMQVVEIAESLAHLLRSEHVSVVFTHAYEGGHPDHDATALAVHAACRMIESRGGPRIELFEMASYHARFSGPCFGDFLPDAGPNTVFWLTADEQQRKRELLDCYQTQRETLRQFTMECERIRPAPQYDFAAAPRAEQIYYEKFTWGMTTPAFLQLARDALAQLRLPSLL